MTSCGWHAPADTCDRPVFAEVVIGNYQGKVCAHHLQRACQVAETRGPGIRSVRAL